MKKLLCLIVGHEYKLADTNHYLTGRYIIRVMEKTGKDFSQVYMTDVPKYLCERCLNGVEKL